MTIRRVTNELEEKIKLESRLQFNTCCSFGGYFFFNLWAQNLGKYTLQPGESANFTVNPRTHDVEYYSELILKKNDTNKLKLSGKKVWFEMDSDIFYGVEEQKLFRRNLSENDDEELPNN